MTTKWNNAKPGSKTWVHSAAALTAGHVVYNIKYLGCVEVTAPKGADIVKEAVTKLKFNKQVKRSEGAKPPKRELTISVDGVTIQEKQTKKMDTNKEQCEKHHSYPLHHISYCADDKSDKKICAFIAKDVKDNKHMCHVMESDKNAEEITLTVGQAFDLAYQKFLSNANMTQEQKMQNETLQRRVTALEAENKMLKQRVVELEAHQGLPPSYSFMSNGEEETSSAKFNPFNSSSSPESDSTDTSSQPPSEPMTAVNLLADFKLGSDFGQPGFDPNERTRRNTLAEQAAAFQANQSLIRASSVSSSSAFDDVFSAPPLASPLASPPPVAEKVLLPPPPVTPRHIEPPAPSPVCASAPPLPEPQPVVPPSPPVNGAQSAAIARSRPRPQAAPQGGGGVIAPPPRSLRRGDSQGPLSPPPTSPSANVGLGLDDLYAAVSQVSKMNGSGAATTSSTSPNPFSTPSSTNEFSFGDGLDFLGNKGSSSVSATNSSTSASNSFSIMDLDPLK